MIRARLARRSRAIVDRLLADWRYPAALAVALLVASVLIAQLFVVRGYREVLDDVDARTSTAECVDLLEEEFQRAITEVVIGLVENDDSALADAVPALRASTDEAAVRACYALNSAP